mmetsp:Transcript_47486/g.154148  ORF Transcript_47486/g.154148 Transcript_47486/m.154148 type:complete len:267 (-) Transcript_47486:619-1419(-)
MKAAFAASGISGPKATRAAPKLRPHRGDCTRTSVFTTGSSSSLGFRSIRKCSMRLKRYWLPPQRTSAAYRSVQSPSIVCSRACRASRSPPPRATNADRGSASQRGGRTGSTRYAQAVHGPCATAFGESAAKLRHSTRDDAPATAAPGSALAARIVASAAAMAGFWSVVAMRTCECASESAPAHQLQQPIDVDASNEFSSCITEQRARMRVALDQGRPPPRSAQGSALGAEPPPPPRLLPPPSPPPPPLPRSASAVGSLRLNFLTRS